jgi:hypothetical protein
VGVSGKEVQVVGLLCAKIYKQKNVVPNKKMQREFTQISLCQFIVDDIMMLMIT